MIAWVAEHFPREQDDAPWGVRADRQVGASVMDVAREVAAGV